MKKIFLDCGAWTGYSVEVFRRVYDSNCDYYIFSFEPNPIYKKNFAHFKNHLFINKAVWISDEERNFYLDYSEKKAGSTLIMSKSSGKLDKDNPIKVRCINLNNWIKDNFNRDDYIILKLDVEGAEYNILPHMIKNGSMDYINKLFIEWHWRKIGLDKKEHGDLVKQIDIPIVERWKTP